MDEYKVVITDNGLRWVRSIGAALVQSPEWKDTPVGEVLKNLLKKVEGAGSSTPLNLTVEEHRVVDDLTIFGSGLNWINNTEERYNG